jgi:hypothetical protein
MFTKNNPSLIFSFFLFASKIFIFFKSVTVPFRGDYVNLRRMVEWRDALRQNRLYHSDRYVVFADVVNEMYKPNGKVEKTVARDCLNGFLAI